MSMQGFRALMLVAGLVLSSGLAAQETYHQRVASAGERRAKLSIEQFEASLSKSRQSGDQSTSRILLSFSRLVAADEIIAEMVALEIELEELHVCVGENCYSFPIERKNPLLAEPAARSEAMQYIEHNEGLLKKQLASETLDTTRHWLLESLRFSEAYRSRMADSDHLLVSGIGCVASDEEIGMLLTAQPSLVRAVEHQGALRRMSIPIEVFRAPNE